MPPRFSPLSRLCRFRRLAAPALGSLESSYLRRIKRRTKSPRRFRESLCDAVARSARRIQSVSHQSKVSRKLTSILHAKESKVFTSPPGEVVDCRRGFVGTL